MKFCYKKLCFSFLISFVLLGCSVAPKLVNMIPVDGDLEFETSGKTFQVGVFTGGEKSNDWEGSKISAHDFRLAFIQTLKQSKPRTIK